MASPLSNETIIDHIPRCSGFPLLRDCDLPPGLHAAPPCCCAPRAHSHPRHRPDVVHLQQLKSCRSDHATMSTTAPLFSVTGRCHKPRSIIRLSSSAPCAPTCASPTHRAAHHLTSSSATPTAPCCCTVHVAPPPDIKMLDVHRPCWQHVPSRGYSCPRPPHPAPTSHSLSRPQRTWPARTRPSIFIVPRRRPRNRRRAPPLCSHHGCCSLSFVYRQLRRPHHRHTPSFDFVFVTGQPRAREREQRRGDQRRHSTRPSACRRSSRQAPASKRCRALLGRVRAAVAASAGSNAEREGRQGDGSKCPCGPAHVVCPFLDDPSMQGLRVGPCRPEKAHCLRRADGSVSSRECGALSVHPGK